MRKAKNWHDISPWEILSERWVKTPTDSPSITIDNKWWIARCPECGNEVDRPQAWFTGHGESGRGGHVNCGCVNGPPVIKPVRKPRAYKPRDGVGTARTVRTIGRLRLTDESERRVGVSFTIPVGLVGRLGEKASAEGRTASSVVTELIREYVTENDHNGVGVGHEGAQEAV